MKILVAGPLPSNSSNGGVAVFTESLIKELRKRKYEVEFFSIEGKMLSPKNFSSLKKLVKDFKPDVVYSSLQYSFFISFIKFKGIKVHFLHGFTNKRDYSSFKFLAMTLIDKFIRKKFDFLLANSEFTKFINEEIYGLSVDGIFHIGLNETELDETGIRKKDFYSRSGVLYVGRLVPAKRVDLIIEAFKKAETSSFLNIVGNGEQLKLLTDIAKKDRRINFLGFKKRNEISKYYENSKVFISLNPSEPYGITYIEALLMGNYIVAPNTGGQTEFLKNYPTRCSLVNINDINEIVEAINKGIRSNLNPLLYDDIYPKFSYSQTVEDIESVIFSHKVI